jgi:hypothetical protein
VAEGVAHRTEASAAVSGGVDLSVGVVARLVLLDIDASAGRRDSLGRFWVLMDRPDRRAPRRVPLAWAVGDFSAGVGTWLRLPMGSGVLGASPR